MNQGCPIYSSNHFTHDLNADRCEVETRRGILPELKKGMYFVPPLYSLTRGQINEREDQGEAAGEQRQQNDDARLRRRIPELMKAVWEKKNHDHLTTIHGFYRAHISNPNVEFMSEDTQMSDVTLVIYEDCPHNLKTYFKENENVKFSTETILNWACQLISVVEHLHVTVGVLHRRINHETVYIFTKPDGSTTLKLGHILFARRGTPSSEQTAERNVPWAYAAPETLIQPGETLAYYGSPADIWSFAMVLYFMIHRRDPFGKDITGCGSANLREHLRVETNRPPLESNVDKDLQDIIKSCWKVNAEDRPTASAIKKKLEDKINRNSQS